ncbi:MAG: hypothetical protein KJ623_02075 [Nanoarchaeota archaeon]|nr:hypothetical protein [Nanoarchaeota archaeon]
MSVNEDITGEHIEQLFTDYINYNCVTAKETLKIIFSENSDLKEEYKLMIEESGILN